MSIHSVQLSYNSTVETNTVNDIIKTTNSTTTKNNVQIIVVCGDIHVYIPTEQRFINIYPFTHSSYVYVITTLILFTYKHITHYFYDCVVHNYHKSHQMAM